MMVGYFDEAKKYGMLTRDKSSGQQSRALLERVQDALEGNTSHIAYQHVNWNYGIELREMKDDVGFRYSETDFHAETLKRMRLSVENTAVPLVLMDEPEQSLDAKAEALLWRQIAAVDTSRLQVIVATHSLYPLLHPDRFNLIEAVPGYAADVRELL
jgi:predicted ATP-dependent endonuclease of OLD family